MFNIIVNGAGGRMGGRIIANTFSDSFSQLVGAVEGVGHKFIEKDAGLVSGGNACGVLITDSLDETIKKTNGDVVIDFTTPDATLSHLKIVSKHQKPIVIGTTGHTEEQKKGIRKFSSQIPIVMSSNMSVGINALWVLIEQAVKILGEGYDIEVLEMHHRLKKDAPSGTAMTTAEVLAQAAGCDLSKSAVYHREGMMGERKSGEIGIQTLRGGDVVGDHTVIFAGQGERLEITHRATSRDIFALGALRAAKWIVEKNPGLYSMKDVLESSSEIQDSRNSSGGRTMR